MFLFLVVLVNLALSITLIDMGMDWLIIGHGLNPWIAFPLASLGLLFSLAVALHEWLLYEETKIYKEYHQQRLARSK